ncbi:hypothetical protein [Lishizhenia sp.]|uniref:hypothetical protein n=1 Tax=Lishizhenia sp. TaxID=2497594 RepID=UPI00299DD055|nr:hypothetical protein [Lishizhenia sp.]MDX1445394.1 hypothetical protein [Lishizhenia sp.]
MESFYSLIYVKPSVLNDELLCVALFTAGAEGPRLYISDKRMRLLSDVVHRNTFLSLRRHLKGFQQQVDKYRNTGNDLLLFDPTYSSDQLQKLSQRSKKAIKYSTPTTVNAWMDEHAHLDLMMKMLGDKPQKKKQVRKSFYHKWRALTNANRYLEFKRNVMVKKVKRNSDLDIKLDLFSKDKKLLIKGLDFDTSSKNVSDRLKELVALSDEFSAYNLMCVYPKPRKKAGRETLNQVMSELSLKIEFVPINDFEAMKF